MRNVPYKSCRENQNTHFVFNNFFFKRAVSEIVWKNMVDWSRSHMTILHMHIACWIPKAANSYSEYVILTAFPLQQWLHERA